MVEARSRILSVVIPVYNEAGTIRAIFARVAASPLVGEIVIVDDGSTDGTREALAALRPPCDGISLRVVRHERNRGKGAAVRTGFARVTRPVTIVQDADLEYDPADYPALVEPVASGQADVVYGTRFQRQDGGSAWIHQVGNQALTFWSNMLTGMHLGDVYTCYKAVATRLLPALHLKSDRFEFEPEFTQRAARLGLRVREVPIRYVPRSRREGKKIGWRDAARCLAATARLALWGG
jgi:glycosyltransferase involved in cell wall biosynthesis